MTDKQIEELMNNSLITQVIAAKDIANMSEEELKDYKYITNVIENNYFNDEQEAEQGVVVDDKQGVVVDDEQGVVVDDEQGVVVDDEQGVVIDDEQGAVIDDEQGVVVDDEQGVVVDDESELDAPVVEEEIN